MDPSRPRAAPRGAADGDEVEVTGGGAYTGRLKANVTPWIHPDAVFMLQGYAPRCRSQPGRADSALPTSACNTASSTDFDPVGGGNALTETIVRVKPAASAGGSR